MDSIQIFIAERDTHLRQALRIVLELENRISVAGEAGSAEELLAQICHQPPDILLLDWKLAGFNPQRTLSVIRRYCPETLVIGSILQPDQKEKALLYGIRHSLIKNQPPESYLANLQEIIRGSDLQEKEIKK